MRRRSLNLWLLAAVAVFALSWGLGRGVLRAPAPDAPTPAPADAPTASPDVPAVHLLILNGSGEPGLAREVGLLAAGIGCLAEGVGNAPGGPAPESLLVNRRLPAPRARALAERLGVPLLTEWDGRTTEDAVLLLGRDHARVTAALDP